MPLEGRTARLTTLIDPRKRALFERLCAEEDATPSQVVRSLIRRYIEERTGQLGVLWEDAPGHLRDGKLRRRLTVRHRVTLRRDRRENPRLNVIAEAGFVLEHVSSARRDQDRGPWEITVEIDDLGTGLGRQ